MTADRTATWSYPTTVRFGAGRIAELPEAARAAGMARPLLVTDRGLAEAPMITAARASLAEAGLAPGLFAELSGDPGDAAVSAGVAALREGGHDGVIAMGGGAALDLGKAVAFMAGQTRPFADFEDKADWWTRANAEAIRPVIAVPTTAGTGSEVGRAAVLSDAASGRKLIVFHPRLLPVEAICDPALTAGLPRAMTVGTGFDAIAHCLEALVAPHWHPMSRGVALEGLRLALPALPRAAEAPEDLAARGDMMAAALMGAVAFQRGLGAVHALSHPIGARFHTHHGTTNAVLLPAVLRAVAPAAREALDQAAALCAIAGGAEGLIDQVVALRRALGVPETLADLGVPREGAEALIPDALLDPSCGGSPVPLTAEALSRILDAAYRPA